jgi:hypothetical protein
MSLESCLTVIGRTVESQTYQGLQFEACRYTRDEDSDSSKSNYHTITTTAWCPNILVVGFPSYTFRGN